VVLPLPEKTEDSDEFAFLDMQIDVFQYRGFTVALTIGFTDIFQLHQWLAGIVGGL
jgi:hypothetical protein